MFDVKTHVIEDIPCLILKGRLDGLGADIFEKKTSTFNPESYHWIVDFEHVDYMSSAGIRALLKKEKELRKKGGMLILFGLDTEVTKVLTLTGLAKHFALMPDQAGAVAHTKSLKKNDQNKIIYTDRGHTYCFSGSLEFNSTIDIWNNSAQSPSQRFDKSSLIQTNLGELGLSFGIGGFGNYPAQAEEGLGLFISLVGAAGISPADGYCRPDFLFTNSPFDIPIFVVQGISFTGDPSLVVHQEKPEPASVEELIGSIGTFLESKLEHTPDAWGFAIHADIKTLKASKIKDKDELADSEYSTSDTEDCKKILILGISYSHKTLTQNDNLRSLLKNQHIITASSSSYSLAFLLEDNPHFEARSFKKAFSTIAHSENVKDVVHVEPGTTLSNITSWIFLPSDIRSADEKRLIIEISDGTSYNPEWDTIVRRIYADCGRVILDQLHGGFTSITFRVTSYDKEGRRLLPTVLKIGSIRNNDREVNAYHKYVKTFILNNSTTIMGTTTYKKWGGLRYNFLGINGPDSNLVWLTDYYIKHPAEKLIPIFDRVFTEILKPWYGQPQWELVYPYAEHSPLLLFSNLFETLEEVMGISPDDPTIHSDELGRDIVNPYHFLKHEYPRRKGQSKLWYKSISHGDLNMQNILLDEKENIYIIDFSETKPRNIVEDFARLEPIFKIEMCAIDNDQDLKEMLQFEQGLLQADNIGDIPPLTYPGDDPMVEKAYTMICKLREYANIVTLFEKDIIPYLVALLEWTYPIVCYTQLSIHKKRYAVLSAALICEKILELEK